MEQTTGGVSLAPAQQTAAEHLLSGMQTAGVLALRAKPGSGRTTVLREIQSRAGGTFLGIRELMAALIERRHPGIEEPFLQILERALANYDLVIVDDLHVIAGVASHSDRYGLLNAALAALLDDAADRGKKLMFGVAPDEVPWPISCRAYPAETDEFTAADYEWICRAYLPAGAADRLDYARLYRFAPALNAHQLKAACQWVKGERAVDADGLVQHLRSHNMTSNVEIKEVAPVDWKDLKGVDDVIQALEAKIALPFENDALVAELGLRPKKGVLLAGPPGTGKTTVGRALARRLKGKFFLIDGTFVAESDCFYDKIDQVFDAAKHNAPSVVFIDDADVIFEGAQRGFYRYLLTLLDGLASASAGRVCVMMTAMNVASVPPAMLRSGRVELWLEMRLPDVKARAAILAEKLSRLPPAIGAADIAALASASQGLTGADLQAVVEDAKLLFAHDKMRGHPLRPAEEYYLEAIKTVRANRRNYHRSKPDRPLDDVKIGFHAD
jgi:transitional endoplasmic reticulum ATPase